MTVPLDEQLVLDAPSLPASTKPPPLRVGALLLAGLLVGAATGGWLATALRGTRTVVVTGSPLTATSVAPLRQGAGAVVNGTLPAVVSISVTSAQDSSEGSGVVVRSDGMVLTADHVVEGAGAIRVTLADGRSSPARLVGRAPGSDLAVLQAVRLRGLVPATFGSVASLRVGDDVLTIGNPLGFAASVTRGIVSALHRTIPVDGEQPPAADPLLGERWHVAARGTVHEAIQTDAAVSPGVSGGALVDLRGHVVGIVTTAVDDTPTDTDTGVAFAIPADLAWSVVQHLLGQTH